MTDVAALIVKLQLFTLAPLLEQPPDQIATRPLLTVSVINVPVGKLELPVVPTLAMSPAGLEETDSPARPVAVSVKSAPAACGFTVSVAVRIAPPPEPVIVIAVALVTEPVVIANVALVAPAATVTLAGSEATVVFELESVTTSPPLGAALVTVIVPVAGPPPVTVGGLSVIVLRLAGGGTELTVSVAVRVVAPCVPVIVIAVAVATELVVTANVALVAPTATVTLAGSEATVVFELDSVTTSPPVGAALVSVTVPLALLPPTTLAGVTLTADKLAAAGGGGAGGAACAVNRRETENGPATPAALMPRTRQNNLCAGKPLIVACETLTVWLNVSGGVKFPEVAIWIS